MFLNKHRPRSPEDWLPGFLASFPDADNTDPETTVPRFTMPDIMLEDDADSNRENPQ